MKPKVKVMLLGIAIMLLGGIIVVNASDFLLFLLSLVPLAGFGIVLYGFFSKDEEEDLPEKIYEILRKQQRDAEVDAVCPEVRRKVQRKLQRLPLVRAQKSRINGKAVVKRSPYFLSNTSFFSVAGVGRWQTKKPAPCRTLSKLRRQKSVCFQDNHR